MMWCAYNTCIDCCNVLSKYFYYQRFIYSEQIISRQVQCLQCTAASQIVTVGVSNLQWIFIDELLFFCLFSYFIVCCCTLPHSNVLSITNAFVKYLLMLFCEKRIKRRSLMNLLPDTWPRPNICLLFFLTKIEYSFFF